MNVYLIQQEDSDLYKIGVSKHTGKRLKENQTGNGNKLNLISSIPCKFAYKVELILHNRFQDKRRNGEWFELNENDVKNFERYCKETDERLKFLKEVNTWIQKNDKFY